VPVAQTSGSCQGREKAQQEPNGEAGRDRKRPRDQAGEWQCVYEQNENTIFTTNAEELVWKRPCFQQQISDVLEPSTALIQAARTGDLIRVNQLLQIGALLNHKNDTGCTALHYAAFYGHVDVIFALVEAGADLEVLNMSGVTPLHWAVNRQHVAAAFTLLDCGANPDVRDKRGRNCLHVAAETGETQIASDLISVGGASVDAVVEDEGATSLHFAAANGHVEVLKVLLENKANINVATHCGATPLYKAVCRGQTEIVRLLCERGAALDGQDKLGRTALHWAAFYDNVAAARLLLEAGATPTVTDTCGGGTPLEMAIRKENAQMTSLLSLY